MKTLLTIFHEHDLLNPKCWCGKIATITCVTCLVYLCSRHSEEEHILRSHETDNLMEQITMKTDSEHLKNPAFWRSLGCELESIDKIPAFSLGCKLENIENQDKLEIVVVVVMDLLCEDSFVIFLGTDTVVDVYKILELRRKEFTT